MRVFEVHVERGRIGGTDPAKSALAAPEFHAALVLRVEIHMYNLSPNTLVVAGFSLGEHVMAKRIRSGVGGARM
jgi:hypothetical protein